MLQYEDKTILSEIKDFFTTSEKAIFSTLDLLNHLRLSEKQLKIVSAPNNQVSNLSKLYLLILFPFFGIKDNYSYAETGLYQIYNKGKDIFYRFMSNPQINWREITYSINKQLLGKISKATDNKNLTPTCLIIDDTDIHKTGKKMELIGKIYSHVSQKMLLGFKGLFMGYYDGKSFFALDFSLHGEKGKNQKRLYGLTTKELKQRFSKKRDKTSPGYMREQEYHLPKTKKAIEMIRTAIKKGIRFDYVLVDSWFTSFELVKFIKTRRIKTHFLGMIKMGKTRYLFNNQLLTAKEIKEVLRKTKKQKRSKLLSVYYSEAIVDFKGIQVKLFFFKTSKRGKWHGLLSTDLELTYEKAYKIYATRWTIEVFFKESKQHLYLEGGQFRDFDSQIANISIRMTQYNILSTIKRMNDYETVGQLFREIEKEKINLTMAEKIWKLICEILLKIASIFEIEAELIMTKIMSDNQHIAKILNFEPLKIVA